MDADSRVENEVAAMSMLRSALKHLEPRLVAKVYACNSRGPSDMWIHQEWRPGVMAEESFQSASYDKKQVMLEQLAEIVKAVQAIKLQPSINHQVWRICF